MSAFIYDIGECRKILGISVVQQNGEIFIHQSQFINDILHQYKMTDCNPTKTPMDPGEKLQTCTSTEGCPDCGQVDSTF